MLDRVDHGADVLAVSSWPVESVASDRVVLVHDYLLTLRGAERTFAALSDLYPDAPVVTLLYDEQGTSGRFAGRHVITSPLQRLGIEQKSFRRLLPLYSTAARHLPTTRYDCIVSSSSAFAHLLLPLAVSLRLARERQGVAGAAAPTAAGALGALAPAPGV
jgi:hypothetical protein